MNTITSSEAYHIPVGRIFGRPFRYAALPREIGQGTLRNLRPFLDLRLSRIASPPEGPMLDQHILTYAVRDGGDYAGRPNYKETLSPEQCAERLTEIAKRSPADLWLAFADASTDTDDGVAMARFMGIVIDSEKQEPHYQPVVQTKLGELAVVPSTYSQGWLHVEV